MMTNYDEIVAIAIAERIGGPDGYNLMLASVKSSLAFSFLNGASSYGAFCIRLLFEHSLCAPFHKRMKETLFSQLHNNSSVNFGLDTCREIDHRVAKKMHSTRIKYRSYSPKDVYSRRTRTRASSKKVPVVN